MIASVSINKENLSIIFSNLDMSLLNSIRRTLISGINVKVLNITEFKNTSKFLYVQKIKEMFKLIRVNQELAKDNTTFTLNVTCDKDYVQVYSDRIKFSTKEAPIRRDLYLFTLKRGDTLSLSGGIIEENRSLVGNFGIKDGLKCKMNIIEYMSPFRTIMKGIVTLIQKFVNFKENPGKAVKVSEGIDYDVNKFGDTILNAITVEINKNLSDDVVLCSYRRNHYLLPDFLLRIYCPDAEKKRIVACDNIINKLLKLADSVKSKMMIKPYTKVIDNY